MRRKSSRKKHACLACHAVDKKLVGPAYKEVAAKYRGDDGAEAKLVEQGEEGRPGNLGPGADAAQFERARRRRARAGEVGPLAEVMHVTRWPRASAQAALHARAARLS